MKTIKQKIIKSRKRKRAKSESKIKGTIRSIRKKGTTSIEEKIKTLLESMNLKFLKEAAIKIGGVTKFYDFYVFKKNEYEFFVECHGGYWHPMIFENNEEKLSIPKEKLTRLQKRNIKNDRFKMRLSERLGIPLLIFYENDINKNIDKLKNIILEQIKT